MTEDRERSEPTASAASLTLDLKQYARDELGFHLVGITSAESSGVVSTTSPRNAV